MVIWEELKKLFSGATDATGQKEVTKMADKKMTLEEVNEYMKKQCGFVPRMFQIINTVTPGTGQDLRRFLREHLRGRRPFPQGERTDVHVGRRGLLLARGASST